MRPVVPTSARRAHTAFYRFILVFSAFLLIAGCDKAKDMNFTLTLNGKKVKVKGLQGIKDLATGKTSMAEASANGSGSESRSSAKVTLVEPATDGKMKLLAGKDRKTVKQGKALVGETLLCRVTTRFHKEKVGDRDSKAGLTFMKNRTISKNYSRFYCRIAPGAEEHAIVYTFVPVPLAKAVHRVAFGGKVNIKLLGRAKRQWYGELTGIVALNGK